MYLGQKDGYGNTEWDNGVKCNVLIKVDNYDIVVYGSTVHEYHTTRLIYDRESQAKWLSVNSDGLPLYIYIGYSEAEESGYLMIDDGSSIICFYTYIE